MPGEPKYTHEQVELILRGWVYKKTFAETAAQYEERFGEKISAQRVRYVKNKYCKDPRYGTPLWNYRDRGYEYDEWLRANPRPRTVPDVNEASAAPRAPPILPPPVPAAPKPRRSRARARASRAKKVEPASSTAVSGSGSGSSVSLDATGFATAPLAAPSLLPALPIVSAATVAPVAPAFSQDTFAGFECPSGDQGTAFDFGSFGFDGFGFDTGFGFDDSFALFGQQPLPDLSQPEPAFPEHPSAFDLFDPQFGADWDNNMGLDDILATGPGLESSPTYYKSEGLKGEQEGRNELLDPALFNEWLPLKIQEQ